jgi:lipopolysaccharide/colanic/teichoic acid biosynthesis glycosyltransferase
MSIVGPAARTSTFCGEISGGIRSLQLSSYFQSRKNGWRGDTSIAKRVEYDLYYLRNWSLTFNLQIIAMTLLRIFNSKTLIDFFRAERVAGLPTRLTQEGDSPL